MHFLLLTVLFLEIFVGYNAQISGDFTCEDGEEYDSCRSPCETTCDNIRRGIKSNCSSSCIPGCFCRRGLVRADDRTCVPPFECTKPTCQENEEYLECGNPCASNCTNFNGPVFCTKPCYRGCFCKQDFVRDSRGRCIHPSECGIAGNVQCPVNEEYVRCVNSCNNCLPYEYCQTPSCTAGCDCKIGYFRSAYGHCITADQCISEQHALQQQCGLNEVYTNCFNPCNDCYLRGRCDGGYYCSPGCDCKPGFFRNDDGVCVPEWNCLRETQPVCPVGEEYYDCIPTCQTCDNVSDVICDTTCNRGCFCKRGFVRRADGLCVLPTQCPGRPQLCPEGEIFYQCLPTCRTTCRTFNSSRGLCSTECRQGCFCQPGFVRNDSGICVPLSQCPSVCGPNREFRTCGSACPFSCDNFRDRRRNCLQHRCLRGCFCKAGFVLGPTGNCIRLRDCPVQNTTPCCSGFGGRSKGNETEEEDTTPVENIPITVTTETQVNDSSNTSSNATKASEIPEKVPNKTTPKPEISSTTPKPGTTSTTPKPGTSSTTPKPRTTSTTPKSVASSTTPKSGSNSTTSKSAASSTTPKLATSSTTLKPAPSSTTLKPAPSSTNPKLEADTTTPKATSDTTLNVSATQSTENKNEPTDSLTNAAETPTASGTESQTNNTEFTTQTDFTNSTEANSTAKP